MIPVSLLDLAPIGAGGDAAASLHASERLAQLAEARGYHRYWLAEHHNMPGIASSATAVLIAHIAACTRRIRVGAGGIMLPNHAPLVVAEQFGTLATLHPGRIDLGLGRAPGTDQATARALRRYFLQADSYPDDVAELLHWFAPATPGQAVRAVPGAGVDVSVWLLGSSLFSARMAAHMGLPYAFASHFAPAALHEALAAYRREFRPSARLAAPRAMAALNVVAAADATSARQLFSSQQQAFVRLRRGERVPLPAPVDNIEDWWRPEEKAMAQAALRCSVVGTPAEVRAGVEAFIAETGIDELIITAHIHDVEARLRSFALAAEALELAPAATD